MALIRKDEYAKKILNDNSNTIIALVEKEISDLTKVIHEKEPNFREVEQMYFEAKKEFDGLQKKLAENEALLKQVSNFRLNRKPDAEMTVVRQKSHLNDKKKTRLWFSWADAGVKILEREKQFIQPDILFDMIVKENMDTVRSVALNQTKLRTARGNFKFRMNQLHKISVETKHGEVIIYKDMYGLRRWMQPNDPKNPLPEFMKQFVFKN